MTPKDRTDRGGALRDFFSPGRGAILALAVVTLVFVFQNTRQTPVRLLVPVVHLPLWVVLFGTLLIGAVLGYYLHSRDRRRR